MVFTLCYRLVLRKETLWCWNWNKSYFFLVYVKSLFCLSLYIQRTGCKLAHIRGISFITYVLFKVDFILKLLLNFIHNWMMFGFYFFKDVFHLFVFWKLFKLLRWRLWLCWFNYFAEEIHFSFILSLIESLIIWSKDLL